MAAARAEVDRHADALVAVVLDGLDLTLADGDGLAEAFGDVGLAVGRAERARMIEDALREFAQPGVGMAESWGRHGVHRW